MIKISDFMSLIYSNQQQSKKHSIEVNEDVAEKCCKRPLRLWQGLPVEPEWAEGAC